MLKGSYTVEAVFVCSFLCLVLILMISLTLGLYEKTRLYGAECEQSIGLIQPAAEMLRIEHAAGGIWDAVSLKRGE